MISIAYLLSANYVPGKERPAHKPNGLIKPMIQNYRAFFSPAALSAFFTDWQKVYHPAGPDLYHLPKFSSDCALSNPPKSPFGKGGLGGIWLLRVWVISEKTFGTRSRSVSILRKNQLIAIARRASCKSLGACHSEGAKRPKHLVLSTIEILASLRLTKNQFCRRLRRKRHSRRRRRP